MSVRRVLPLGWAAAVVSVLCGCAGRPKGRATEFASREDGPVVVMSGARSVMGGVRARVQLAISKELAEGASAASREAISDALDEIDEVEAALSAFRPGSDLRRLTDAPPGVWVELGPYSLEVFALSRSLWERSGGAFDITVGPLMFAWGFRGGSGVRVPSHEELSRVMEAVGMQKLELDLRAARARKLAAGMRLDAGAIAKGYAVDRAARRMRLAAEGKLAGYRGTLVEIGGEVLALGDKGPGRPWRIGVERPRKGDVAGTFVLPAPGGLQAVASSADTWQYFIHDGVRYRHIVDPRTGMASCGAVVGATVLAPDCATADGLATALCVLEPSEGLRLVKDWPGGAEALIFLDADGELRLEKTEGFPAFVGSGD